MRKYQDIAYVENGAEAQKLDLWLPDSGSFPVFVFFHGGGMEAGDKADEAFLPELAEAGIGVVSANYRMYPGAKFPDFVEDAAAAVDWTVKHIGEYGKKVAEYLRNFDYYDNKMFLDEEGQYFSYREETVNEPYVITYHSRHYYEIWIPDLSKTTLYVDYNAFGQKDECEIDLSSLFEEIKTKEAQL